VTTQASYADFSQLATLASRGLAALAGLETHVDPDAGIDAGLRLCSMLAAALASGEEGSGGTDADLEPLLQFAVGLLNEDLPRAVVEKLAHRAAQVKQDLERLASDKRSLSREQIEQRTELFAQFAIVLRDYGL